MPEQQMDASTPAGKMVFTVLGAVAEFERSLIVERVKAGLRNARAKGQRLARPRTILDTKRIATLRAPGVGCKRIAAGLGVGVGTIYRVARHGSKTREKVF
jgi:DNA invertase Pin-like site-specific DNA recombinase